MESASDRPDAREIVSARFFPLPPEAVFPAFSDPARLAQWWGPRGFTNTFHVFEFRPGGAWKFTMRGPDGTGYAMDKEFVEIVRPERIVLRHFQQAHEFVLIMTFAGKGGGTVLTWRMLFADPAEAARLQEFLRKANEENFDRLEAHLSAKMSVPPAIVR